MLNSWVGMVESMIACPCFVSIYLRIVGFDFFYYSALTSTNFLWHSFQIFFLVPILCLFLCSSPSSTWTPKSMYFASVGCGPNFARSRIGFGSMSESHHGHLITESPAHYFSTSPFIWVARTQNKWRWPSYSPSTGRFWLDSLWSEALMADWWNL